MNRRYAIKNLLAVIMLAVAGCSSNGASEQLTLAVENSGNGGEGNYGGVEVAVMAVTDDVTYITQFGLMRGHLLVGVELYRRGEQQSAATHMKHPEDELYAALVPALEARGAQPMAAELSALARAVESGQSQAVVENAYRELLSVISAAEQAADLESRELGEVITELVRTAAEEYSIARAENGSVVNVHEYQDSFGFVEVARQLQDQLVAAGANPDPSQAIADILASIASIWPDLVPPRRLETVPAAVYSAAARVEIATLRL